MSVESNPKGASEYQDRSVPVCASGIYPWKNPEVRIGVLYFASEVENKSFGERLNWPVQGFGRTKTPL